MWQFNLYFICLIVLGFVLVPADANASLNISEADTTSEVKKDSTTNDILLYPDALPARSARGFLSNPSQELSVQIGATDQELGVEFIYTADETRSFFSLAFGTLRLDDFLNVRTNLMTSLTYGYKANITPKNNVSIAGALDFLGTPEFYVRIGPGLSTLSVNRTFSGSRDRETERLIGFHTFGMVGSSLQLAERSRLNIELGWRGLWFPGSNEFNFINGPQVSFGFSFSGGPQGIDPVNW